MNSLPIIKSILSTTLITFYWLLLIIITFRLFSKRKQTSSVVSWLLLVYILPVFGVILYFIFVENYIGYRRFKKSKKFKENIISYIKQFTQKVNEDDKKNQLNEINLKANSLFKLCENQIGVDVTFNNKIELLADNDLIFEAILNDINNAATTIELVFYILENQGKVKDIYESLIAAAKRGVKCKIMLDSVGSRLFLKSKDCTKLREVGIDVITVLPVNLIRLLSQRLDIRQHRKIIIIDQKIMYTGSMNLVDPNCFNQDKSVGKWVDILIRIEGMASLLMHIIFCCDLEIETHQKVNPMINHSLSFNSASLNKISNEHLVHLLPSGPGYSENMIHQMLLTAVYNAKHEITLTTPYLVPSDALLQALCFASLRGVNISIIIPKYNNSIMVKWASRAFFTDLLKNNINIYQYKNNLLHTKSILIDKSYALVGTANLDMRSLWLNFELTTIIEDQKFSNELDQLMKEYLKDSELVNQENWIKRPFWQRIVERLFYFFSPLL